MTKRCTRCERELPIDGFPNAKKGGCNARNKAIEKKDICRECNNEMLRARQRGITRARIFDNKELFPWIVDQHGRYVEHAKPSDVELEAVEVVSKKMDGRLPTLQELIAHRGADDHPSDIEFSCEVDKIVEGSIVAK